MSSLATRDAVEKLTRAARGMGPEDLLEFHDELFPGEPISGLDPVDGADAVRRKVLDYLGEGLEVEEILDLWFLIVPGARDVSYDDETETIHYLEESESIR